MIWVTWILFSQYEQEVDKQQWWQEDTSTSTNDGIYSVTVDGGADTCLDGKGHIFLEYTPRVANVVGFDDDVTKTNQLKADLNYSV